MFELVRADYAFLLWTLLIFLSLLRLGGGEPRPKCGKFLKILMTLTSWMTLVQSTIVVTTYVVPEAGYTVAVKCVSKRPNPRIVFDAQNLVRVLLCADQVQNGN
jgi:hypothetical protein